MCMYIYIYMYVYIYIYIYIYIYVIMVRMHVDNRRPLHAGLLLPPAPPWQAPSELLNHTLTITYVTYII